MLYSFVKHCHVPGTTGENKIKPFEIMETDHTYMDKPVHVKLVTGETLPDGIRYWGQSSISENLLWFGIPKPDEVHKSEVEFHVPKTSIAYILVEGNDI